MESVNEKSKNPQVTNVYRWLEVEVMKRPDIDFRIACCTGVFLPSWPPPLVLLVPPSGRVCVEAKFAEFKNDEGEVL